MSLCAGAPRRRSKTVRAVARALAVRGDTGADMLIRPIGSALVIGSLLAAPAAAQQQATPAPQAATATAAAPDAPKPQASEPTTKEDMKLSAEKDVGYGAETSFLTWHGYLDLEFLKQETVPSTFDLHEFYLSAKAQIAPKVSITAEFEYE